MNDMGVFNMTVIYVLLVTIGLLLLFKASSKPGKSKWRYFLSGAAMLSIALIWICYVPRLRNRPAGIPLPAPASTHEPFQALPSH